MINMEYSFYKFEKNAIERFLALDKYKYIIEEKNKCNISTNKEYQKTFNRFFMIRRDERWRKIYYTYFEQIKNKKDITFQEIIKYLYNKTGNIEASFSSKMLAIINPNMPIWDQYIISNLELKVEGKDKKERLNNTICIYNEIMKEEKELLKRQDIQQSIKEFKDKYNDYKLTDIKILDYLLWNNR